MQSSEEINKENDEELRLKNHIILSSDQLYSQCDQWCRYTNFWSVYRQVWIIGGYFVKPGKILTNLAL